MPMTYCRLALILLVPAALVLAVACSSLGYYGQAIGGQLKLLHQRQSIEALLLDNDTEPRLKDQLQQVQQIRSFALYDLHLPENDSYSTYAETGREAVVWNVIAAPADSLAPQTWCYPVAGCVPYRGYFKQENANKFAARLAGKGLDIAISPATAYSTLGWFDDPLLDTMLRYADYRLAGVIFHELAHQRLYLKGDATFNESFASAVERAGIEAWIEKHGDEAQKTRWLEYRNRQVDFNALLSRTRQKLQKLYQFGAGQATMAGQKAAIFAELRLEYEGLKATWNNYSGYDGWIAQELNNAHFALHATYENGTAEFECLFRQNNADFEAFYAAATEISQWEQELRSAWLSAQDNDPSHCTSEESVPL